MIQGQFNAFSSLSSKPKSQQPGSYQQALSVKRTTTSPEQDNAETSGFAHRIITVYSTVDLTSTNFLI